MTYWIWDELGTISMLENNTEEGVVIVDVRDLLDGSGNTVDKVAEKIMLVGNLLCSGQRVIVRCRAGMSRSNTIACAAMMWISTDYTWDAAWAKVKKACPRAGLNMDFFETVKEALIKLNGNFGANKMCDRLEINRPINKSPESPIVVSNKKYEKEREEMILAILRQSQFKPLTKDEIIEKSKGLVSMIDIERTLKKHIQEIFQPYEGKYEMLPAETINREEPKKKIEIIGYFNERAYTNIDAEEVPEVVRELMFDKGFTTVYRAIKEQVEHDEYTLNHSDVM